MRVQVVLALGRSRLAFREVQTKYFGNSMEGDVRLRPGSWEASKQGGDSVGHEIRQEFGLGHVWSLQKEQHEHRHGPQEGLQEVPSMTCII